MPDATHATPSQVGRFVLHAEIARGGMGVVYRATDPTLDREVAVKVLAERLSGRPDSVRRFLAEARVSGQLQHPGIPPVHEVGALPDGRPFLAMKLIRGQTLAEVLAGDPDRGRLVAVFEAVAQAVGYAHSRGVLHRDLKPANVMVGAFGEVQVMDWGLAKVLNPVGREAESAEPSADPDVTEVHTPDSQVPDDDGTRAGTVLGTPAFMPPEQAGGETDKIDRRADVFGLGAVLCVLLTGKPPYVGDGSEAVRLMAVRGQVSDAFARLDGCGAEPGLVALCKRCLAADPADRPADAGAVAAAVAALRTDAEARARRAEVERARAEGQAAEQRKRRRVQLALGLVLLVGTAAAAAGTLYGRALRTQRRQATAAGVNALLDRVEMNVELNRMERLTAESNADAQATVARWAECRKLLGEAEAVATAGTADGDLLARLSRFRQVVADGTVVAVARLDRTRKRITAAATWMNEGHPAAISRREQAVAADPGHPGTHLLLAETYAAHDRRTEAAASLRTVVRLATDQLLSDKASRLAVKVGNAELADGNETVTRDLYELGARRNSNREALTRLAVLRHAAGEESAARDLFARASERPAPDGAGFDPDDDPNSDPEEPDINYESLCVLLGQCGRNADRL